MVEAARELQTSCRLALLVRRFSSNNLIHNLIKLGLEPTNGVNRNSISPCYIRHKSNCFTIADQPSQTSSTRYALWTGGSTKVRQAQQLMNASTIERSRNKRISMGAFS